LDRLKIEIRNVHINYRVRQKRSVSQKRFSLTKQLIRTRNAFHANKSCDVSIINSLGSQLSSLISKEAEGAKISSCAQWFKEGEVPTRFVFRLEQKRAENDSFDSFFDGSGVERSSQKDLENILGLLRLIHKKDDRRLLKIGARFLC